MVSNGWEARSEFEEKQPELARVEYDLNVVEQLLGFFVRVGKRGCVRCPGCKAEPKRVPLRFSPNLWTGLRCSKCRKTAPHLDWYTTKELN